MTMREYIMEETNLTKYAIIQTGGKQYQVVEGKTLAVELLPGNPGDEVLFDQVLLRKLAEDSLEIGQPHVKGAVKASIIKHIKGKKIIVLRFKRRKKVRVKKGHRQLGTVVRIEAI
jgi:large subunit ribosomal protein L21